MRRLATAVVTFAVGLVLAPRCVDATQKFGPIQLSGNVQSANIVRTPDVDTYEFIMNRNTIHLRLDYDWLQSGKFYNKYDIPFVESSHLSVLWRGVYDSVYDTTPGFSQKEDIHGRAYSGNLTLDQYRRVKGFPSSVLKLDGLSRDERDILRFENQLREFYADIKFRNLPLTVRAGRQQIVWGEADNFRMLDRVNTLDLTWHLAQELPPPGYGWDEIRRPFWMIKFLYELGDVWKLSQSFLEWYWNPGDWYPAKVAFLPRPWGFPSLNPLTNPIDGAFIGGPCGLSPFRVKSGPNAGLGLCTGLMNGTKLFERGDYSRNPIDNSQVGVRYHGITPFGLEFTLNYLHQRWGNDDGTDAAPIRGLPKTPANVNLTSQLEQRGIFPAEYFAPYVNTLGTSGNYSDETYTQTVFRYETIYDLGVPFFDVAKETTIDRPLLPGVRRKNMWKGMVGFDRPTWIKTLNKKSTIFFSGQFFWHYLVNDPGCQPQNVANMSSAEKRRVGECIVGGFDLPSVPRLGNSPGEPAYRDKVREWESLFSLAAFTFYRGGSIVPVTGIAVDWVNQFALEPFWGVDYVIRDDFLINIAQRYFVTPRGHSEALYSPWGFGSISRGRSETELRLTYQF
jgi:hypothetical protein